MINQPSVAVDSSRAASMLGSLWALYAGWLSSYGSAILTTISIVYAVYLFIIRDKEHKVFMKRNGGPYVEPSE